MQDRLTETNGGLVKTYQEMTDQLQEAVRVAKIEVDSAVQALSFVQQIAELITTKAIEDESWISDYTPPETSFDPPDEVLKAQEGWLRDDLEGMLNDLIARRNGLAFRAGAEKAKKALEEDMVITDGLAAASGFFVVDGECYNLEVEKKTI
jgi:hypothetical protein